MVDADGQTTHFNEELSVKYARGRIEGMALHLLVNVEILTVS
jgi:hypothetical protein